MNKKEQKSLLSKVLIDCLDPQMSHLGFSRLPTTLCYTRHIEDTIQEFIFEFSANPSYAPGMLMHLQPMVRIKNSRISNLALQLVEDPLLLAGAPEILQNVRLNMLRSPQDPEWYVHDLSDLPSFVDAIRIYFQDDAIDFLADYATPAGIVAQHETQDTRPLKQRHWYVYVLAAYLLLNKTEEAKSIVSAHFGSPGLMRRYRSLWDNIQKVEPGVVADLSRLQKGYRSKGRG